MQMFFDFIELYPLAGFLFVVFLGAIVGSFLNVVIYRLPVMIDFELAEMVKENSEVVKPYVHDAYRKGLNLTLSLPRSRCGSCDTMIPWYHNIPMFSYLILKGKCFNCKTAFSSRYFIVELIHTVAWSLLYYKFGATIDFTVTAILFSLILCMTYIDFDHKILPDGLVFSTYALGLLFSTTTHGLIDSSNAILMSIGSFVIFKLFIDGYSKLRGKTMMGFGDIKLIAAFTTFIGLYNLLYAMIIACAIGIIYYLYIMLSKKVDEDKTFAFGPFICIGCYSMLIYHLI